VRFLLSGVFGCAHFCAHRPLLCFWRAGLPTRPVNSIRVRADVPAGNGNRATWRQSAYRVHTSQPLAPSRIREVWRELYRTRDATFDSFSAALPILSTRRIPCVGGTGSKKLNTHGQSARGTRGHGGLSLEESRYIGFIVWADGNQREFVTSHTQQSNWHMGSNWSV
jgi:hypothetical protein